MSQSITHTKTRPFKMDFIKAILHASGIYSVIYGFIFNLENIKGGIIAIIGICYISAQLVFFVDRQLDIRQIRKINRWREEQKAKGEGWK